MCQDMHMIQETTPQNLSCTCYVEASSSSERTSHPSIVAVTLLKKGSLLFQGLWHHGPHAKLPSPSKGKEQCW